MSSSEHFREVVLMDEPAVLAPEPTREQRADERAGEIEKDPHFQFLLAMRDGAVSRIRVAILADLQKCGVVSERVLNLIRQFKEDWQDFRFGDLIQYDDVFEESDNG